MDSIINVTNELKDKIPEENVHEKGKECGEVKDVALDARRRENIIERPEKRPGHFVDPIDERRLGIGPKEPEKKP